MSGTKKTLVGKAPDGSRVELRTSGSYCYAGVARYHGSSTWEVILRGVSQPSVEKRMKTWYNLNFTRIAEWDTVPLAEQLLQPVEEYFASRPLEHGARPRVTQVFSPAEGWQDAAALRLDGCPTRAWVRHLQREGWTALSAGNLSRWADFDISELLKPRRPRRLLGGTLIGSRTGG